MGKHNKATSTRKTVIGGAYKQEANPLLDPALSALALDAKDYPNAVDYVNLYLELLQVDREKFSTQDILENSSVAPFFIKDLKSQVDKIPDKKCKERLIKFFNLNNKGERKYLLKVRQNDIAMINFIQNAFMATHYLTTFDSMYAFNQHMHEIVDLIASKVRGNLPNTLKVKYAHIYYRYIKNFQFLSDYDDDGFKESTNVRTTGKLSEKQLEDEEKLVSFQSIGMLIDEWNFFFRKIPDNDIIVSQIQNFLSELDDEYLDVIMKDAQLVSRPYRWRPSYKEIRTVKEAIFPDGEWLISDFMCVSSLDSLYANQVRELCQSWVKYAEQYEWLDYQGCENIEMDIILPIQGRKHITIPVFSKNLHFKSVFEMMSFLNLLEYFKKEEPSYMYHNKKFDKYNFFEVLAEGGYQI